MTALLRDKFRIISNKRMDTANELWDMFVDAPDVAALCRPGQIAHIYCGAPTTLRRPISVCDCVAGALRFCYEVRGEGTRLMSEMKAGDYIDIMAPTGNGFTVPAENERIILAGGGIGIFPLLSLARYGNASALLGFRSAPHVCLSGDFADYGADVRIISDDGSTGRRGFVTDLLIEALDTTGADRVYICGPRVMMRRCAEICTARGVACEVSMEERMACGVGACLGCVCDTTEGRRRVCVDGPVFDGGKILWN